MNLELFKYPKHIKEFKGILKINCMDCGHYGVIYNHQIGEGIADREITSLRFKCSNCDSRKTFAQGYLPANYDCIDKIAHTTRE
jgi:ribosomal protein S27E